MAQPLFQIQSSQIEGLGAFAVRPIRKGTRIIEYLGERISPEEADVRYDDDSAPHLHVVLFTIDNETVIDAGVGGNDARFINHSCDPNCLSLVDKKRVFIEARRDIPAGEELTYDYNLQLEEKPDEETKARYACYCGSKKCRGTMLELKKRKSKRKKN
jgi:SET domain-containing protein